MSVPKHSTLTTILIKSVCLYDLIYLLSTYSLCHSVSSHFKRPISDEATRSRDIAYENISRLWEVQRATKICE